MMRRLLPAGVVALLLVGCAPVAETTDWDAADRDAIGYDEFFGEFQQTGVYNLWDADEDDYLSQNEWQAGLGDRFGTYDVNRWGMYGDWDRDRSGYLDDIEFSSGVFDRYDLDGDNYLAGDEVADFDRDWMQPS